LGNEETAGKEVAPARKVGGVEQKRRVALQAGVESSVVRHVVVGVRCGAVARTGEGHKK
jgi:hypothetical protein